MCYAVYTNAQRQGIVLNMTIAEMKRAAVFRRGFTSFYTISVWEHKTTGSFGSAKVVLPEWVFSLLKKYVEQYRGDSEDHDLVFVTRTGERISKLVGELEKLSSQFGKKVCYIHTIHAYIHFTMIPYLNTDILHPDNP